MDPSAYHTCTVSDCLGNSIVIAEDGNRLAKQQSLLKYLQEKGAKGWQIISIGLPDDYQFFEIKFEISRDRNAKYAYEVATVAITPGEQAVIAINLNRCSTILYYSYLEEMRVKGWSLGFKTTPDQHGHFEVYLIRKFK